MDVVDGVDGVERCTVAQGPPPSLPAHKAKLAAEGYRPHREGVLRPGLASNQGEDPLR